MFFLCQICRDTQHRSVSEQGERKTFSLPPSVLNCRKTAMFSSLEGSKPNISITSTSLVAFAMTSPPPPFVRMEKKGWALPAPSDGRRRAGAAGTRGPVAPLLPGKGRGEVAGLGQGEGWHNCWRVVVHFFPLSGPAYKLGKSR